MSLRVGSPFTIKIEQDKGSKVRRGEVKGRKHRRGEGEGGER